MPHNKPTNRPYQNTTFLIERSLEGLDVSLEVLMRGVSEAIEHVYLNQFGHLSGHSLHRETE